MEKSVLKALFLLLLTVCPVFSANDMVNVYFNAGTEKYLQGDYSAAIVNLEKAYELDSKNQKIQDLLIKVIIDAGTNYNLTRDYQNAIKYLEKGLKVAPDNEKIKELYQVTQETLSKGKTDKTGPKSGLKPESAPIIKEEAPPAVETPRVEKKKPALKPEPELVKTASGKIEKPAPVYAAAPAPKPLQPLVEKKQNVYILTSMFTAAILLIIIVIILVLRIINLNKLVKALKLSIDEKQAEFGAEKIKLIETIEQDKDVLRAKELELEKMSLEKKMRAELEKKISEINKQRVPEFAKVESETRNFSIKTEKQDLKEFASNTDLNKDKNIFVEQPSLVQARDRIATRTQSLYDQSPEVALQFIKETIANPNPAVRSNIVKSLAVIATQETLELLFELNKDPDEAVRREVIKSLRMLSRKINEAQIQLPEDIKTNIYKLLQEELEKGEWIF
ncbi:MAG: hypothetical protein A3J83_04680 [Elusimicrobia bacterium RIFOXYA2_FULL_40_6]|nr:MAG: hypothetical protein A3J83_04680 [Elusimicrobia bacterium RIFOXYA2_FULL_40_6]